jgi:hypothetical protein
MHLEDEKPSLVNEIKAKRQELETQLKKIERTIYEIEGKYIENSTVSGSILRGWDHIFTAKPKISTSVIQTGKPKKCQQSDRLFSQTSFENGSYRESSLNSNSLIKQSTNYNCINDNSDNLLRKKFKKKMLSLKKKKTLPNGSKNINDIY